MKRSDIAWLAGLIEGEGTIFKRGAKYKGQRYSWIFSLEMTDKDVVEKACKIWGYGSVRQIPARQRPNAFGTKDIYVWRFEERSQVYALGAAIYTFMGERRKAAIKAALLDLPPVLRNRNYKRKQS